MSRKEVRRRQPSGSFFMPSPISPEGMSRGCPVIPRSDAGSREYPLLSFRTFGKHILHLFIIGFFSLPNRPRCGHLVIPHLMRNPENTGKFTRKILFPGPSIAVRGDTVLDVVSRIYPLFIPKENSRQYRPGHWGARPCVLNLPFLFPQKKRESQKKAPG